MPRAYGLDDEALALALTLEVTVSTNAEADDQSRCAEGCLS